VSIQNFQDQLNAWEELKDKAPFNVIYMELRCKYCNSKDITRYGHYKNEQLWWCKNCEHKFTDNKANPGMKVPLDRIQFAMSMYYKGISLKSIRRQLDEEYGYYPSDSTLYRWIHQLIQKVLEDTSNHQPNVGSTWIVFETSIMFGNKKYWVLDLLDTLTRFQLASRLSSTRNIEDIVILIESAMNKSQKIPEEIIARRTTKYLKGAERTLGANIKKVQIRTPGRDERRFSAYWHNIIKERSNIVHNLKSSEIFRLSLDGWITYYNYYLTQESLKGKTPSQKAKIEYSYGANRWVGKV
jgi:transposase-like protein